MQWLSSEFSIDCKPVCTGLELRAFCPKLRHLAKASAAPGPPCQASPSGAGPASVDQQLRGLEAQLVVHFPAAIDPVSQVQRWQPQPARQLDLPQNGESP